MLTECSLCPGTLWAACFVWVFSCQSSEPNERGNKTGHRESQTSLLRQMKLLPDNVAATGFMQQTLESDGFLHPDFPRKGNLRWVIRTEQKLSVLWVTDPRIKGEKRSLFYVLFQRDTQGYLRKSSLHWNYRNGQELFFRVMNVLARLILTEAL